MGKYNNDSSRVHVYLPAVKNTQKNTPASLPETILYLKDAVHYHINVACLVHAWTRRSFYRSVNIPSKLDYDKSLYL